MRGKNETGGGASAETLYDALVIRGISSRFPMECNHSGHIHLALLAHGDRLQAANRYPHGPTVCFRGVYNLLQLLLIMKFVSLSVTDLTGSVIQHRTQNAKRVGKFQRVQLRIFSVG